MCNFALCNYTSLGDGICNPECRNKDCAFDYCDCYDYSDINSATIAEQEQCGYNETQCNLQTECFVSPITTTSSWTSWGDVNDSKEEYEDEYQESSEKLVSWVGDAICDNECNNKYCNFDGGDCQGCSQICEEYWYIIELGANFYTTDYKISQAELCVRWDVVVALLGREPTYNCNDSVIAYDLNNDTLLNAYEAVILLYHEYEDQSHANLYKAEQINCSLCAPSVEVYYS